MGMLLDTRLTVDDHGKQRWEIPTDEPSACAALHYVEASCRLTRHYDRSRTCLSPNSMCHACFRSPLALSTFRPLQGVGQKMTDDDAIAEIESHLSWAFFSPLYPLILAPGPLSSRLLQISTTSAMPSTRTGRSPSPVPPSLPTWPPNLSQAQHGHLLDLATTFALSHGFTLLPPDSTHPATHAFSAPLSLFPTPFPKGLYDLARDLQPLYNGLYAR